MQREAMLGSFYCNVAGGDWEMVLLLRRIGYLVGSPTKQHPFSEP